MFITTFIHTFLFLNIIPTSITLFNTSAQPTNIYILLPNSHPLLVPILTIIPTLTISFILFLTALMEIFNCSAISVCVTFGFFQIISIFFCCVLLRFFSTFLVYFLIHFVEPHYRTVYINSL